MLAPMAMELKPIIKRLGARRSVTAGPKVFVGVRDTVEITVCQLGVGPTVAARTTQRLLDQLSVDQVVVSGIAGGIVPSSTIGTVIVPEVVLDVSSGREFRPSPLGQSVMEGTIGTVDELISDPSRLAQLAGRE